MSQVVRAKAEGTVAAGLWKKYSVKKGGRNEDAY